MKNYRKILTLDELYRLGDDFMNGKEDFEYGTEYSECPYDEDTDAEAGWKNGWKYAEWKEKHPMVRVIKK